mmetsp:Transcript_50980/g.51384  ORF Transcript_50980/g.51384 Transcript_50980/m.51384 type:complete len:223 (-) Transcript_50980:55-723(-)
MRNTSLGRFDATTGRLKELPALPRFRLCFLAAAVGRDVFVMGKRFLNEGGPLEPVPLAFDTETLRWWRCSALLLSVSDAALAVVHRFVLVLGGQTEFDEAESVIQCYDATTDSWSILEQRIARPRYKFLAIALEDGRVVVAGGLVRSVNRFERFVDAIELSMQRIVAIWGILSPLIMLRGLVHYGRAMLDTNHNSSVHNAVVQFLVSRDCPRELFTNVCAYL